MRAGSLGETRLKRRVSWWENILHWRLQVPTFFSQKALAVCVLIRRSVDEAWRKMDVVSSCQERRRTEGVAVG